MLLFVALVLLLFFGGGAALSYYVEALWFGSLGLRRRVLEDRQPPGGACSPSAGSSRSLRSMAPSCALKPPRFGEIGTDGVIIINDRPVKAAGRPRPVADRAS